MFRSRVILALPFLLAIERKPGMSSCFNSGESNRRNCPATTQPCRNRSVACKKIIGSLCRLSMRRHDNNEMRRALAAQVYAPDVCAIAGHRTCQSAESVCGNRAMVKPRSRTASPRQCRAWGVIQPDLKAEQPHLDTDRCGCLCGWALALCAIPEWEPSGGKILLGLA